MIEYLFVGDSWAEKAWTESNYQTSTQPTDVRLADWWPGQYTKITVPGQGNLALLDRIQQLQVPDHVPIVWIFTEPGRDYGRVTGQDQFDWIRSSEFFNTRKQLEPAILSTIRLELPNPIALIGGLADVNTLMAESLGFHVLCSSWQQWIANTLNSQWFKKGWGASDIGWRMHYDNVIPSHEATFAWDEQIKEWCWWEDEGYFCHEHPTPRANQEFAQCLKPGVEQWLKNQTS